MKTQMRVIAACMQGAVQRKAAYYKPIGGSLAMALTSFDQLAVTVGIQYG